MPIYLNNHSKRGIRNNNPLNIRRNNSNNWLGKIKYKDSQDNLFEQFTYLAYGLRASLILITNYYQKNNCKSITKIISRWAPPSENNTNEYINFVANKMGVSKDVDLALTDVTLSNLLRYMTMYENGMSESEVMNLFNSSNALNDALAMWEDRNVKMEDLYDTLPMIIIDSYQSTKGEKKSILKTILLTCSIFVIIYYGFIKKK